MANLEKKSARENPDYLAAYFYIKTALQMDATLCLPINLNKLKEQFKIAEDSFINQEMEVTNV